MSKFVKHKRKTRRKAIAQAEFDAQGGLQNPDLFSSWCGTTQRTKYYRVTQRAEDGITATSRERAVKI